MNDSNSIREAPAMSQQQPAPSLRVLTGLHAGAVCVLPDGRFSIGSEPPADILLGDEHVAARHIVVDRDGDGLRLSIEAGGVAIEGAQLAAGDVVAAAMPVSISIGNVELRCEAAEEIAPPPQAQRQRAPSRYGLPWDAQLWGARLWPIGRRRISAVGAGAALGVTLLAAAAIIPAATNAFAAPRAKQPSALPAKPPQAAATSDATLRGETQRQLQANGLPDISLDVSSSVVTARGQLDPALGGRLHDVELWFDHRFGETAVFISQVSLQAPRKFTLALDAVWAGSDPNVVIHGQKYYVGASLPGGATIDQITQRQVLVSQAGQHYAVDY